MGGIVPTLLILHFCLCGSLGLDSLKSKDQGPILKGKRSLRMPERVRGEMQIKTTMAFGMAGKIHVAVHTKSPADWEWDDYIADLERNYPIGGLFSLG